MFKRIPTIIGLDMFIFAYIVIVCLSHVYLAAIMIF